MSLNYLYQEKPTKDADMISHITFTYQQLEVLRILVPAPVPLVIIGLLNWIGVGPRGVGDKVLGTVLDNTVMNTVSQSRIRDRI